MGKRARAVAIAAVTLVTEALAACVDVSGFASDGVDAATSGSEEAGVSDSTAGDAGGGGDADAAGDPDARAAFSCKTLMPAPLFCDDFDDKTTAGEGWTATINAGFVIALDDTVAVSPPKSVLLSAVSAADAGTYKQQLVKRFQKTYSSIDVEFDARVESGHYRFYPINVVGTVGASSRIYSLWLYLEDANCVLVENAYDFTQSQTILNEQFPFVTPIKAGVWRHFQLSATLSAAPAVPSRVTLRIDGTTMLDAVTLDPQWRPLDLEVDFGLAYQALPSNNVARLDNVVVRALP